LKKRCTRLAAATDKIYQLLAHGRWFSPGTPASSTTKTGRHDIAEILFESDVKHHKKPVSLDCSFLIAPSAFSNVYSVIIPNLKFKI
jgi:hypothetical protein